MPIQLTRIDDRLIHGQVATTWVNQKGIEQIILINDAVAKDKVQKSILLMTAPVGIKVLVMGTDEAVNALTHNVIKRNTMLILKDSIDVLKLVEGGVDIKELNVGGMRYAANRKQYTKSVFMSDEEKAAFEKMIFKGIKVTIQMVPNDPAVSLKSVISKED